MIRINVKKEYLENFIDGLENDFNLKTIKFLDFKTLFCNDKFDFSEDINKELYLKLYDNISSNWNNNFYVKIREFIIDTFMKTIKFCPYCWKTPLIYFDENNKKKRMFQFDHFFPKNYYHKWIINFYNLIPSCNACNHLKLEDNPMNIIWNLWSVFHPYFWNLYLDSMGNLKKDYWKNADIKLNYISKNSKFLKLWQKYLNSQDTFNIFNFIQDKRTKIKAEKYNFKKTLKSDDELINYFFKNYYPEKEEDILKYSNWKFTRDLIENLKAKHL